jgi:predicted membrane-bound spermidine synthase
MSRLRRLFPLAFVTVTGAVVMALEILGTRVIGTVFGTSVFVWGALLTTTLVCLAVGYAVGGLLADRWPRDWLLYVLTLLAGAAAMTIPAWQGILEPCFQRFGPRAGALVAAFAIFTAPLTLLGLASPYVVRLLTRSVQGSGRTAGAVFALSTTGSVAGTLLTSFYLIPELGTRWSLAAAAGALMLISAVGLLLAGGARTAPACALAALAWAIGRGGPPAGGEVLCRVESPYSRIAVVQPQSPRAAGGGYRMLFANGILQTGMPLDVARRDRTSLLRTDSYYLELLPYFHDDPDEPRTCLVIGLAGGFFARVMERYPVRVTAVEIDVKVAELARAYFGYRGRIVYPDGRQHAVDLGRFPRRELADAADDAAPHQAEDDPAEPYDGVVVIQDGRRFLQSSPHRYDFIVLDAYSGDTIPFHLITREMFLAVREHLRDDGVLAINYIGAPAGDDVTDSLAATLADVFGRDRIIAYRSTDDAEAVQVIYFFVFRGQARQPSLPPGRWFAAGEVDPLAYELHSRRLEFDFRRGVVITDDHNPIDVARVRTALSWRAQTLAQFRRLELHRF